MKVEDALVDGEASYSAEAQQWKPSGKEDKCVFEGWFPCSYAFK